MLLKKQTVWLLTMLSLVVVLSVYYITSPEGKNSDNVAFEQDKETDAKNVETATDEGKKSDVIVEEDKDGNVISSISSDDLFAQLRMEIDESRSKLRQTLQDMTASTDLSAEEKSKAFSDLKKLDAIETKEQIIETLIKGNNYEDAIVRVDGDKVKITVKSKESSKTAANEILRLVASELGDLQDVLVTFEAPKE